MIRLAAAALLLAAATASAQAPLPAVDLEDADWPQLRLQLKRLLHPVLKDLLPPRVRDELHAMLGQEPSKPSAAVEVQKLLDPFCLIGVNINPESRVKVARGPAKAELVKGRDSFVLVKVHNDAGVTAPLGVGGTQLIPTAGSREGHWLEAAVVGKRPLSPRLLGQRLEYVVLRLRAHQAGKREATFKFDVGQGTQDLGFRAETPILFTVREKSE